MIALASLACSACRGHEFAEGFNHIGWGPIRVMQLYAVVLFGWIIFNLDKPENPRRDKVFAWTLNLVMVPAVILAHLATVR